MSKDEALLTLENFLFRLKYSLFVLIITIFCKMDIMLFSINSLLIWYMKLAAI